MITSAKDTQRKTQRKVRVSFVSGGNNSGTSPYREYYVYVYVYVYVCVYVYVYVDVYVCVDGGRREGKLKGCQGKERQGRRKKQGGHFSATPNISCS